MNKMKKLYDFEQFSKNETRMFAGDTGWQGPSVDIPYEPIRRDEYDLFSLDGEWLNSGDETKIGLSFHPNGLFCKGYGGKEYTSEECYVTKREGGVPVPDGPKYTIPQPDGITRITEVVYSYQAGNGMLWGPKK